MKYGGGGEDNRLYSHSIDYVSIDDFTIEVFAATYSNGDVPGPNPHTHQYIGSGDYNSENGAWQFVRQNGFSGDRLRFRYRKSDTNYDILSNQHNGHSPNRDRIQHSVVMVSGGVLSFDHSNGIGTDDNVLATQPTRGYPRLDLGARRLDTWSYTDYFYGEFSEVRIHSVPRSTEWRTMSLQSIKDRLVDFEQESRFDDTATSPYENLARFSKVDFPQAGHPVPPPNPKRLVVSPLSASVVDMEREERVFLYKDYGPSAFGDFEIEFEAGPTSHPDGGSSGFSVCTVTNDYATQPSLTNGVGVNLQQGSRMQVYITEFGVGSTLVVDFGGGSNGLPQKYFCTFKRVGTLATLTMYTDAARTITAFTNSRTVSTTSYRFLHIVNSQETGGSSGFRRSNGYTGKYEIIIP